MPEERKSVTRRSDLTSEISDLVRTNGITRDQARRLINRIGKNRAKLNHAATILKARLSPRRAIVSDNLSHQMDDSAPQLGIVDPNKSLDEPQTV
jgi:hypothetical protein